MQNPEHFKGQSHIKFSDLFRFRGLLGQGSYGVVMIVQDKVLSQQKEAGNKEASSVQQMASGTATLTNV